MERLGSTPPRTTSSPPWGLTSAAGEAHLRKKRAEHRVAAGASGRVYQRAGCAGAALDKQEGRHCRETSTAPATSLGRLRVASRADASCRRRAGPPRKWALADSTSLAHRRLEIARRIHCLGVVDSAARQARQGAYRGERSKGQAWSKRGRTMQGVPWPAVDVSEGRQVGPPSRGSPSIVGRALWARACFDALVWR